MSILFIIKVEIFFSNNHVGFPQLSSQLNLEYLINFEHIV